jgi:hypothetical protein
MLRLFHALALLCVAARALAAPLHSDYEVFKMAEAGQDEVDAQVEWKKVYMGSGMATIRGNAFYLGALSCVFSAWQCLPPSC